ncbi:MAG: DUF3786 domain-containing protein [Planctomycetota bacterium]|jgi:hypothetical protein
MAHKELWEQLVGLDGLKTAERAKCQYLEDPQRYVVTMLNSEYLVNVADRKIFSVGPGSSPKPAEFLEQLCILAYLINAKDLPVANELVKAETLPGGQFFFRGHHSLPIKKLEKTFGEHPELLYQSSEQFGAKRCGYGDAAIELYILPRVPVTIIVWRGDDEFSARASILFDRTAAAHLLLDALLAAVNLAVKALTGTCGQDS